jgi:hypothetical protein
MALTVEDGIGLAGADSYISLADARTYAASYGYALPVDDTEAEVTLRNGALYVDLQESCFSGSRLTNTQALSWPRKDFTNALGVDLDDGAMPVALGYAQVAAAAEFAKGIDVRASDDGKAIESETVTGAVAVSYFNTGSGSSVVITRAIDALKTLLSSCANNGFEFRVGR